MQRLFGYNSARSGRDYSSGRSFLSISGHKWTSEVIMPLLTRIGVVLSYSSQFSWTKSQPSSKVQFMKSFEHGNRKVFTSGELISQENRQLDKLWVELLKEWAWCYSAESLIHVANDFSYHIKCSKDGRKLGTMAPHDFIGEMAFLVFCQNIKHDEEAPFARASANVIADGIVHVWEWDARKLAQILKEDRDLSNAFTAFCSHDLRRKLLSANAGGVSKLTETINK